MEKQKVYTAILSDYFICMLCNNNNNNNNNANIMSGAFRSTTGQQFFVGFCPNLDFVDQQEKFATCVTKFAQAIKPAEAAFICKILCFEVTKILFGQLVDWMLVNKSLHKREIRPPPPLPAWRAHLWRIFLALPIKNGPLLAELKFRENTAYYWYFLNHQQHPPLQNLLLTV